MEPLANNVNAEPVVEDVFAVVDNTATEPTVNTPAVIIPKQTSLSVFSSNIKYFFWRWRKFFLILLIIILLSVITGGVLFWLKQRGLTATSVTNKATTNTVNDNIVTPLTNSANITPPLSNTNQNNSIDSDFDGLTDGEEIVYNTNPKKTDTDEDGLSDREEVRVYGTDPRNPDTDKDSYTDGNEVKHFYDPNNTDPNKRLFTIPKQ
ncbi:MAG: hypothetical protein WCW27_04620 [Patescibacteria group bacterium]|jgi:hypothetical protein